MIHDTNRARHNRHNLQDIIRIRFPESLIAESQTNLCQYCVYLEMDEEQFGCVHDLLPIGMNGQPCIYFVTHNSIAGQA